MNLLHYFRLRQSIRAKQLQLASINGALRLSKALLAHATQPKPGE